MRTTRRAEATLDVSVSGGVTVSNDTIRSEIGGPEITAFVETLGNLVPFEAEDGTVQEKFFAPC